MRSGPAGTLNATSKAVRIEQGIATRCILPRHLGRGRESIRSIDGDTPGGITGSSSE